MGRSRGAPGGGGPPKDWSKSNPKYKSGVKLSKHARKKKASGKQAKFVGTAMTIPHLSLRWDSIKMNRETGKAMLRKKREQKQG